MAYCKDSRWDVFGTIKVYECEKCGSKSFKRLDHLIDNSIVSSVNMNEEQEELFDSTKSALNALSIKG